MERYAVFLDIDNTIMEDPIIPERNIRAIQKARERGHLFFLNTGRGYPLIPKHLFEKIQFDGFVAGLGTYVKVGEESLTRVELPREIHRRAAEMMLANGNTGRLQGPEHLFTVGYEENGSTPLYDLADFDAHPEFIGSKVTVDGRLPEAYMEELGQWFRMYIHRSYMEGAPYGCDKATGMLQVLEYLNIPRERCIAIGDSVNDEDMLRWAGTAVVMGDGDPEMMKLAHLVTCSCLEGGVGEAVEKLLLKN